MKYFFALFILVASIASFAQNEKSASQLLNKLANAADDTLKADIYLNLGQYYYEDKYDSASVYIDEGLKFARSKKLKVSEAGLLIAKSRIIIYKGSYNEAIDTLKKALGILRSNDMWDRSASALTSIGVVFYNKSQYDSCKYYWNESLKIYEKLDDSSGIATIKSNIGVVNYIQGNAEVALKNYLEALSIREKLKENKGLASLYMKIALIYQSFFENYTEAYNYVSQAVRLYDSVNNKLGKTKALINLGNTLELMDSTKKAMEIFEEARISAEAIGNKRLLSTIYSQLGENLTDKHEYKKALEYLYKARDNNEEMGQIRELSVIYRRIGRIFFELADYNTALSYYAKSLEQFDELNIHSGKARIYKLMAETSAKMNNYKKAYEFYESFVNENDSVRSKENKEVLAEMEAKFANQQKEQKIQYLEREQMLKNEQISKSKAIRNLLIGMALLVLAIAILFYQRFRQKAALNEILKKRNEDIKYKSSNIKEFNKLLLDKNELIQKQNSEMAESNKTKDRIFSIIGHDLRSPMGNLITSLNLLQTKKFSEEKIAYIYRLMENDIASAMDLLENLLMWAKKQEGRIMLQPQNQKFNPVAENVIQSLKGLAQNKSISIDFESAKDDLLYFDKSMISAVLRNLLVNALKFTKIGGAIQLSASAKFDQFIVSVADNGIGMDQDTIRKISKEGSYYTQPGTNKEKGSGLGLSLCFDIVKLHGGTLSIESHPDKGSVFTFCIPKK